MKAVGISDIGRCRKNNEDAYYLAEEDAPLQHLYIVADGMGGCNAGEVASNGAIEAFVASASAVLLHLPLPEKLPPMEDFLPMLPPGLRAFALYVQAHYLYLKEEYGHSVGIVEGALAMGGNEYPIPAIYLHLVAVMDYMSLREREKAEVHMLAAWKIAQPDDLIEGLGEHHGLLGGVCWRQLSNPNGQKILKESLTSRIVSLRDGVEFIIPSQVMMLQTI